MIHIITPCTRPENLPYLAESIPKECHWVVVYDASVKDAALVEGATTLYSPHTGYAGNPNRNFALDSIELQDLDWVYILDDDNIMHPDWYSSVSGLNFSHLNMVTWGQVWRNNSVRLVPTAYPQVGNIDTSCYMVRGRAMKTLRYSLDYVADGIMAEQAYTYGGLLKLDEYIGYYNYLRTPEDRMH
jgi:hypothetical protein